MSMKYEDTKCSCLFEYLVPFTRFWGLFTSVVLCGVGVDVTFHHHIMGIYIIVSALVVFFLEITWTVTLFLQVCSRGEGGLCTRCWAAVLWIDGWKKSLLYTALAGALIARPHRLWLSTVAGVMLILLAASYLLLAFRSRFDSTADSGLLQAGREESYDRFDEVPEVFDDTLLPGTSSCPTSPSRNPNAAVDRQTERQAERQELILEI